MHYLFIYHQRNILKPHGHRVVQRGLHIPANKQDLFDTRRSCSVVQNRVRLSLPTFHCVYISIIMQNINIDMNIKKYTIYILFGYATAISHRMLMITHVRALHIT